jgi:hypothetical protein
MWIVYQKKDRKVVGMSALYSQDIAKDAAVAQIVKGLVSGGPVEKYDALQVEDAAQAMGLISTPLRQVLITESRGKLQAAVETPEVSLLLLSSDAPDAHPVDGVPEIKADGTSFTTITVQKVNERGEPRQARSDNEELYLRTTAGTILSADGKAAIASIKLKQGEAAFRLLSEKARRVATVSVFHGDPTLHDASISVEFI